jgi:hypothetical protein
MSSQLEWFPDWFYRHMKRFHWFEWPKEPDKQLITAETFESNMVSRGIVHEAVAEVASVRLAGEDHAFQKHLPKFLAMAGAVSLERAKTTGVVDQQSAIDASKACPDCEGTGLTHRFRHKAQPHERLVIDCICNLCAMGRWISSRLAQSPDVQGFVNLNDPHYTFLRFAEHANGLFDNPYRHKPNDWDWANDCPIDDVLSPVLANCIKQIKEARGGIFAKAQTGRPDRPP